MYVFGAFFVLFRKVDLVEVKNVYLEISMGDLDIYENLFIFDWSDKIFISFFLLKLIC